VPSLLVADVSLAARWAAGRYWLAAFPGRDLADDRGVGRAGSSINRGPRLSLVCRPCICSGHVMRVRDFQRVRPRPGSSRLCLSFAVGWTTKTSFGRLKLRDREDGLPVGRGWAMLWRGSPPTWISVTFWLLAALSTVTVVDMWFGDVVKQVRSSRIRPSADSAGTAIVLVSFLVVVSITSHDVQRWRAGSIDMLLVRHIEVPPRSGLVRRGARRYDCSTDNGGRDLLWSPCR